jgi:hypothetical protein
MLFIRLDTGHDALVELLNLEGKVLRERVLERGLNRIDISDMPAGVFLIRIHLEMGPVYGKLIKR